MLGFLAPDGLCKAFDASGNGYGRGEGVIAIILKPASAAIRDRDHIRAVIRGTGVNQDGKTPGGITVPNSEAQRDLIASTYAAAGLTYEDTGYFEAHVSWRAERGLQSEIEGKPAAGTGGLGCGSCQGARFLELKVWTQG